jgi:hypothetical protein
MEFHYFICKIIKPTSALYYGTKWTVSYEWLEMCPAVP